MKNLMLGYVQASEHKKPEVLNLIAKILEFTSDELQLAMGGSQSKSGWLGGLWRTTPPSVPLQSEASTCSWMFVFGHDKAMTGVHENCY